MKGSAFQIRTSVGGFSGSGFGWLSTLRLNPGGMPVRASLLNT